MEPTMASLCLIMQLALPMTKKQSANACKYEQHIIAESVKNDVDPFLLASVIYVESGFYPRVVSNVNACGLTQVIPKYTGGPETGYKKYTCKQLKNPKIAIKVGAQILSYNTRVYGGGNEDKGLCFYSTGVKCFKEGFYKKSRYVKKVRRIWNEIKDGC